METTTDKIQAWINERIREDQVTKYMRNGRDFVDEKAITTALTANKKPDPRRIADIAQKALAIESLTLEETAALLHVQDPGQWEMLRDTALRIKKKVYDNRVVTFAPLYLGSLCVNNCSYCGFRRDNADSKRRMLSQEEVRGETKVLAGTIGHKRLIVVCGEHPKTDVDYLVSTIKTIYAVREKTRHGWGQIRRVNVNAAPLSIEDLAILKQAGLGTYQVFQETYHHDTYRRLHPAGTIKAHYPWRLYCMHRAQEAGVDDVGIGALFGLYDWRFEVLGLVSHARDLEEQFGIGPHTISFPRLEPADNMSYSHRNPYSVGDDDFKKLVTVIRLAVPYTGMIITARETAKIRQEAFSFGCTQTDASSRIGVGAYAEEYERQQGRRQQFFLGDTRSLDEVIRDFAERGYITSFCTAGYRCGRTGKCIMDLLRSGAEGKFCKLNAVLTFREWLDDFASPQTLAVGETVIARELKEIQEKMPAAYPELMKMYELTRSGTRDLYF